MEDRAGPTAGRTPWIVSGLLLVPLGVWTAVLLWALVFGRAMSGACTSCIDEADRAYRWGLTGLTVGLAVPLLVAAVLAVTGKRWWVVAMVGTAFVSGPALMVAAMSASSAA